MTGITIKSNGTAATTKVSVGEHVIPVLELHIHLSGQRLLYAEMTVPVAELEFHNLDADLFDQIKQEARS